jgi:hypothetical protein
MDYPDLFRFPILREAKGFPTPTAARGSNAGLFFRAGLFEESDDSHACAFVQEKFNN